jgi:hypothetical protein
MGSPLIGALMVGAGEYTTGCVFTASGPASDKPAGVIALCFLDLRRRGKVRCSIGVVKTHKVKSLGGHGRTS